MASVSVVTTCKKGDPALDELKKALNKQTFKDFEFIVIDEPCKIAEGYNKAVKEASGDLIVITETDCIPKENWLEELVQMAKEKGRGNIILGATSKSHYNLSSVCLYKSDFVDFNEDFVLSEDTEWFSRLKGMGKNIILTNNKGIVEHKRTRRTYKNQLKIAFLEAYYVPRIHKIHGKHSIVSPWIFFLSYCFQSLVLFMRFLGLFVGIIRWKIFWR